MDNISLSFLTQTPRRLEEIVSVFAKYGLAGWIPSDSPEFLKAKFKAASGRLIAEYTVEERIRLALTELGTTFIKLGQMLSTRADLVGPGLAQELSYLQQDTPTDPPEIVRAILEQELGNPPEELFASFDDQASASASIAQVHLARLFDGTEVVVKVQHAGIEEKIAQDLDILMFLADLAERYSSELRLYQPREIAAQFRRRLTHELDLRRELRNLNLFIQNFRGDPTLHIPRPYPELSSQRILTMEKLEGFSVANLPRLQQEHIDKKELAKKGANIYLEMIFRDGFFHADPHPGNIFVLSENRIGLLDFGMVGRIDNMTRDTLEDLVQALLNEDTEQLTDYLIRICTVPTDLNRDALQVDLSDYVAEHARQSIKDLDVNEIFTRGLDIIRSYHIIIPARIYLLIKVLVQLEGTSRLLDTDFDLLQLLRPYYVKMVQRRYAPQRLWRKLYRSYQRWQRLLDMLPGEVSELLKLARKGQIEVRLEHRGLDVPINRMVYGIITAALFLGSTALWSQRIPPLIGDTSVFGFLGSLLAVILGIRLLWAIKRSGGLSRDR